MSNAVPSPATLRSGYMLQDPSQFASNIDAMMKQTLGIADAEIEEEEVDVPEESENAEGAELEEAEDEEASAKDEL